MEKILLDVQARDIKLSPSYLRQQRKIPGIIYGRKEKSMPLVMDYQMFRKAFDKAGTNQVIELKIEGKMKPVLVHQVQYNPLTDRVDHVDFLQIDMNEEVKAHVPVVLTGVAPAVKDFGGILTTLKHELEVRCLPGDLPQSLTIDISGLLQLHASIHASEIVLPKGVKLTSAADDVIVTVSPPKVEEEAPAATAATAEGAAPAAEGAATAEGAAPAAAAPEKK